jgi:hypothetical protein
MFQNEVVMGMLWRKREEENQIRMLEAVNSELKSGNACYISIQNLLSSRVRSKTIEIKIYRTIIFPVLCACENWRTTLREENRLRVFENRVLRNISGYERGY